MKRLLTLIIIPIFGLLFISNSKAINFLPDPQFADITNANIITEDYVFEVIGFSGSQVPAISHRVIACDELPSFYRSDVEDTENYIRGGNGEYGYSFTSNGNCSVYIVYPIEDLEGQYVVEYDDSLSSGSTYSILSYGTLPNVVYSNSTGAAWHYTDESSNETSGTL